ncbi:MAG: hypothetical protein LBI44_04535 [Oscillospiraceae bacterium]|jgi:ATP-dependent DNA helicase RecG|nr:hypothetical protein [Oscillospiraceae bacterium]
MSDREALRRPQDMEDTERDFSADVCPGATEDDLDADAVNLYYEAYTRGGGAADIDARRLPNECGALEGGGVTYAALILFGKSEALARFLPQAHIVYEYYTPAEDEAAPARLELREELRDCFFFNLPRLWALVDEHNEKQHYQDGRHIHTVPLFNERVTHEALINAVCHRDYRLDAGIYVRQSGAALLIESPGAFHADIAVDDVTGTRFARNGRLLGILKLCALADCSGRGMKTIFAQSVKEAKPLPDYGESDENAVRLTLNGSVENRHILAVMRRIGRELLDAMTTDDYILLYALIHGKNLDTIHLSQYEHLVELGVAKHTERGLVSAYSSRTAVKKISAAAAMAKNAAPKKRRQTQRIMKRKKQIIDFIANNHTATSIMLAECTGLTQKRVRALLCELGRENLVKKNNQRRYASYTLEIQQDTAE